jgi:hypothetical protein
MPEAVEKISESVVRLLDKTPWLRGCRGDEIKAWLSEHPEVDKYAILDDDSDMLDEQLPNFFKTTFQDGLTDDIAEKVTEHLGRI